MFEKIVQTDQELLLFFNGLHSPFGDVLMYWMTHLSFWLPFLVVLLWVLWKHYRKQFPLIAAAFLLSILLSDQTSVLIKNKVERYRPSHTAEIQDYLHLHQSKNGEIYRGGKYGFVSSHAANSFCVMVLCLYFFKPIKRRIVWIFPAWAILFCYTRIYLGVHYPLDIVCGALLGTSYGLLILYLYRFVVGKMKVEK